MTAATEIFTKRTTCRLCDEPNLALVLPIKASPIADAFVPIDRVNENQPLIPLDLYQCSACGHVQNLDIVNPELLFRDYIFTTGSSAGLVEHFRKYSQEIAQSFSLSPNSLVVEIGSNDGTLLKFFKDVGMVVLGVDPARDIAESATLAGVETIPEYFDLQLASKIRKERGAAKLIVANNVYAHCDQLGSLTEGISLLLDSDGIFVFEVSYLLDIIDKFVFDTVYHEHLSYHSVKPFVAFFAKYGMQLFDIKSISTKGGSIRGFVQKVGGPNKVQSVINQMVVQEDRRGLHSPEIFQDYDRRIQQKNNELHEFLKPLKAAGKCLVGYGASTTVTTLMYHFELTELLDFLIDDNKKKHGLLSPGCHLPVKPATALLEEKPDVVVILAWQYAEPIIAKNEAFLAAGGMFVVPLPEFRVITRQ